MRPAPDLSGYDYLGPLAFGANAEVHCYRDRLLQREVAVKVGIEPLSTIRRRRFMHVVEAMAHMSPHPNFVTLHAAGFTGDDLGYLVMEFAPGPTLAHFMDAKQLELDSIIRIGIGVGSALHALHEHGVVHRDVKPSNLLTTKFGVVVLSDLDVARFANSPQSLDQFGFTAEWAAPELLRGESDGSVGTDIYSLSATLWAMLSGFSPHRVSPTDGRDTVAQRAVRRIRDIEATPAGREEVDHRQEFTVAASLELADFLIEILVRGHRPRSARDFASALEALQRTLGLPMSDGPTADTEDVGESTSARAGNRPSEPEEPTGPVVTVSAPDDRAALLARGDAAVFAGKSGNIDEAVSLFRSVVEDRTRILGPDDRDTLKARGNLATWVGRSGDVAGAVSLFRSLVLDRTRLFTSTDESTMIARGNLATWVGRSGDVAEAVSLFRSLVEDRTRVLGPDHPGTLLAMNNLAMWLGRLDSTASANDSSSTDVREGEPN